MIPVNETLPGKLNALARWPDLGQVHDKRVLVFGFSPHWINYFALISMVLVHRGCRVDFVWTPVYEHDNADVVAHAESVREIFEPAFASVSHDRFRAFNLRDLPMAQLSDEMLDEVRAQSREDVTHFTREVKTDPERDAPRLFGRRQHYNHECMASLLSLFQKNEYDLVLEPNGKVYEWGIVYRLASILGVAVSSVESFRCGFDQAFVHSFEHPAILWNEETIAAAWKANEPHIASDLTRERVRKLQERFDAPDKDLSLQFCEGGQADTLRERLGLDQDRPIVLLLPSLGYEKFYRLEHYCFRDGVDWYLESLNYLAGRDDCYLVIRSHPFPYGDGREDPMNHRSSGEIPERLMEEHFAKLPENLRFISATEEINTYDLMAIGDWALCYSSVTGLEMALAGKSAVVPTSIHYNGKGFTRAPRTHEEYFAAIDTLLADPSRGRLNPRQIELAQCYVEVFYYLYPSPFPWNISIGGFLYEEWPLERVLSLEGLLSPFMDTFDALVERRPHTDAQKLAELRSYLAAIAGSAGSGDFASTTRLLGHLEEVDFSALAARYPESSAHLVQRWTALAELVRGCRGAEDFARLAEATAQATGTEEWFAQELLKLRPLRVEQRLVKGTALYRERDVDGAMVLFREALDLDQNCAQAWNNIGVILHGSHQQDAALKAFETGLAADPGNVDCQRNYAALRMELQPTS